MSGVNAEASKHVGLMNPKRQYNQQTLDLNAQSDGEAARLWPQADEAVMAKHDEESPASTMEEICESENVRQALRRVCENKGSAGVDGMHVEQLSEHLKTHWPKIKTQLMEGKYKPQAIKRVEIPKPDGGIRVLGIPTVLDRFIQQAVMQVLQAKWDKTFSNSSFGFRPGRSAHMAVEQAQKYIAEGKAIVVDIDLEKFFDLVNHDVLMNRIGRRERDKRVLKLIGSMLRAGMMQDGVVIEREQGTPQGGPLSPLLSNLLLDELDKELERRGLSFVRYADDCNIYVRSERAGERVMESIKKFITKKLKLRVNESKSAVAKPYQRTFLGFSFTWDRGVKVKRRLSPRTIERFKDQIRELTSRRAESSRNYMEKLRRYIMGWLGYFRFCQTPSALLALQSWVRHRVRNLIWRQWQQPATRVAELRKLGIKPDDAYAYGNSSLGSWHMTTAQPINKALSNRYLEQLGLPDFNRWIR